MLLIVCEACRSGQCKDCYVGAVQDPRIIGGWRCVCSHTADVVGSAGHPKREKKNASSTSS